MGDSADTTIGHFQAQYCVRWIAVSKDETLGPKYVESCISGYTPRRLKA
jgi:hypothetical protein